MGGRGISPVVGVVLMVAIILLLVSMFTALVGGFAELGTEKEQVKGLLGGSDSWENSSNDALYPVKDPGEEPRTSGDDILEFRIKNDGDEQVTVKRFEINATGISPTMEIDDANADELEVRRTTQTGTANRDGGPDSFDATGTEYDLITNSTTTSQYAVINAGTDDAEVDIRRFSRGIGTLEFADSEESADLTVSLILDSGSKETFYFDQQ